MRPLNHSEIKEEQHLNEHDYRAG